MNAIQRELQAVSRDRDHWRRKVCRARHPDPLLVEYVVRLDQRVRELERHLREEEQA